MTNKYWHRINIDIEDALNPAYQQMIRIKTNLPWFWIIDIDKLFRKSWLDYMSSLGVSLSKKAVIFHKKPNEWHKIAHIDLSDDADSSTNPTSAINWVFGSKDSEMLWYKTPDDYLVRTEETFKASKYKIINVAEWPVDNLEIIDRCSIQLQPTLVNVITAHAVNNSGDEDRYCVSVRFDGFESLSWEETVEWFREKGLLLN